MKTIVINGRFLLHRVTGVERYARELTAELDRIAEPGEFELAVPPEAENIPEYRNIRVIRTGKLHNRLWEHLSLPAYVRRRGAVSLNLCNTAPLPAPGIVCIHDMKVNAVPESFSRAGRIWYHLLFRNETRRALHILTVSGFSKKEIMKYCGVPEDRITVISNGWEHSERILCRDNAPERYGLEAENYYFTVSSPEPSKNFRRIAEMAERHPGQQFAAAGAISSAVFADGLGFAVPENLHLLGYIPDEDVKGLMRHCRAFLFPSLYEGFGIPPLEAIAAGARCIAASDIPVLHEVLGENVNYIEPSGPVPDLKELKLLTREEAAEILSRYSWSRSAEQLYRLLKRI